MTEILTIKNFGPITDLTIDLRKVNILIGENATGKSTVAKVLAVCRYFSYIAYNNSIAFSDTSSSFFQGLTSWGIGDFIRENTCIEYECDDYLFKIEKKNNATIANKDEQGNVIHAIDNERIWNIMLNGKSNKFKNLLNELGKLTMGSIAQPNDPGFNWIVPTSFYQNDVSSVMDNPFYLPTERGLQSIFSLGKSSIQNIEDSLFNQFAKLDLIARNYKNETSIETFNITYKNIEGRGYIKKDSGAEYYSLNNSASGYKSAIPIILSLKYYDEIRMKNKTFLIEEPELNLFPAAQNKLIQYLVEKSVVFGHSFILTTHSPYILTSLNNLMYSYEVGKKEHEETEKVIDKKYWINPEYVSAYMLLNDGTCEDIVDREEGLIKAEKIDDVTNILNEQFDALLNIELVPK